MKINQAMEAPRQGPRLRRLLAAAGLLLLPVAVLAVDSGPTVDGEICMQRVYGAPVSNANRLNCTANDISLSQVISVTPDTCTLGTTFDLEATFAVAVTANSRYDAGFFFRTDGGTNARGDGSGATGVCSLSGLTPGTPPALNLDGDTCGDLNSGSFEVTFTIPDVLCQDSDGDSKLNLPYCTSWHSNHATACDISSPFVVADAFDFRPDTKSKCVCDDNFEVPVVVEEAELVVVKDASPTSVPEPGGEVTYTATVTNIAQVESVVISSILDDIYGDLGDALNGNVSDNTCPGLIGETLGPGADLSCSFKGDVFGDAGDRVTDVVIFCADQASIGTEICGDDDADVDITDESEVPSLVKDVQSTSNCWVDASYQVVVNNHSEFDILTVNSLTDDQFGNITAVSGNVISTTCAVPQDIDPLQNYTCGFVGRISDADCELNHTNVVTADTVDDDGVTASPSDSAQVILTTTP